MPPTSNNSGPGHPYPQDSGQHQPGGYGLPSAPPVELPPNPGAVPVDSALRLVLVLMFVNLGLSVVLTILMLIFRNSVIDFQLAHTHLPPNASPHALETVRASLQGALWGRVAGIVIVSVLYVWRSFALRRGSRRAYLRLIWICVLGLLGIAYIIAAGQYPVWMRVEQVLQAIVLAAMLWAVTRKQVRYRYYKQRPVG